MSYRRSWSRQFYPDEYNVEGIYGAPHPINCPSHKDSDGKSFCFRIGGGMNLNPYVGTWYMSTPLRVIDVMPGTKAKILKVSAKTMAVPGGFGSNWGAVENKLMLLSGDKTHLWESGNLFIPEREWGVNSLAVNRDLGQSDTFMLSLYQAVFIALGEWYGHVAEARFDGEYYTETPAPTATVKVTVKNSATGALVKNAYVALMSGTRVVADGYTDGGAVEFKSIDEGSYTIIITAGGYNDFDQSIEVAPPSEWYTVKIVPIPTVPIPDWVWYVVGGVAVVTAVVAVPAIIRSRQKPEERIIMVR